MSGVTLDRPAPGLEIAQPARGFRYGAEAFWLAGFALETRPLARDALDLGTGSGIVALLLARAGLDVLGVDVRPEWAELWPRTLAGSAPRGRVELRLADVLDVVAEVDLVVSNPPYFPAGSGPSAPDPWKAAARTEAGATVADFVAASVRCLRVGGAACFVVPRDREDVVTGAPRARRAARAHRAAPQPDRADAGRGRPGHAGRGVRRRTGVCWLVRRRCRRRGGALPGLLMLDLRLRIRAQPRTPGTPEAESAHLEDLVRRALDAGGAAPVAVVVQPERAELLELRALVQAGVRVAPFLAGLTRSQPEDAGPALAVGVAGRFQVRRGDRHVPVALAFLEWPDCRWSLWQVLVGPDGQVVPDSDVRRRAEDGDALPLGLGRWWSLGRRTNARVRYAGPLRPVLSEPASPLVH